MNNGDIENIVQKLNDFTQNGNISQDAINNVLSMLNNSSNQSNSTNSTNYENGNNIDFETIMKMKSIIDKMNSKDDPRTNLLKSLKPYLNENRKSKVDQYIGLMNMSKVMDAFPFMNGGKSNDK